MPKFRAKHPGYYWWLIVAAVFGTAFVKQLKLPLNASYVDVIFVALFAMQLPVLGRGEGTCSLTWRKSRPFFWLFILGSFVSVLAGSSSVDGLIQVAKDLLPVLAFFAVWSVLESRPRLIRPAQWSYVLAGLLVVTTIFLDQSYRSGGILNANYAPHFLSVAILVAFTLRAPPLIKAFLVLLFVFGMLQAGSFGSLAVLSGFIFYWVWSRGSKSSLGPRIFFQVALAGLLFFLVPAIEQQLGETGLGVGSGFEAERYERSSDGRWDMYRSGWEVASESPLGVGPGGYRYISQSGFLNEMHNTPLRFLLENGIIGLAGIVGIVLTIFRQTPVGGAARALMLGLLLGSLARDSWNFRHAWVGLAIVVAYDQLPQISRRSAFDAAQGGSER